MTMNFLAEPPAKAAEITAGKRILQRSNVTLGSSVLNCRLRPIVFTDCDLTLAALGRADLRETDLSGLRLREANLVEADLRGCDLRGSDLAGARLRGTRLEGADLRGARLDPDGWVQARLTGATTSWAIRSPGPIANGSRPWLIRTTSTSPR